MINQKLFLMSLGFIILLCSCHSSADTKEKSSTQNAETKEMPVVPELITNNFSAEYKGTIDQKYIIELELIRFKDLIGGSYKYEGKNHSLILKGQMEDTGEISMSEYNEQGEITGSFEGKIQGEQFNGTWFNKNKTKGMPFSLTRKSISSLQTKTDILSDAMGQYLLSSISGNAGANTMFDTYKDQHNQWTSTESSNIGGQREGKDIKLTERDIQFLNNLQIVVDEYMNVHVYAGLIELINCPFNPSGMEYRVTETDKKKMNEKIAALSPSDIIQDDHLYLLADDEMDFSETLKGSFNVVAANNMILTYYPTERKFELNIFVGSCCDGNILTFTKR